MNLRTLNLAKRMHSKLSENGYSISYEWSELFAQAFEDYILNSKEGKEYVVDLCQFSWHTGESDVEVQVADTDIVIPGNEVYYLEAAVIQGKFVPRTHVDEYPILTERCLSCGVFSHCYVEIDGKRYCSHCLHHTEEHRNKFDHECPKCTVVKCPHHRLFSDTI